MLSITTYNYLDIDFRNVLFLGRGSWKTINLTHLILCSHMPEPFRPERGMTLGGLQSRQWGHRTNTHD